MPRQQIALPRDEIYALYVTGHSTVALARRFHCSPTTIASRLRTCGARIRRARFDAVPISEAALRQQYEVQRLPLAEIASNFAVSLSTISNRRRAYGIPSRNRKHQE